MSALLQHNKINLPYVKKIITFILSAFIVLYYYVLFFSIYLTSCFYDVKIRFTGRDILLDPVSYIKNLLTGFIEIQLFRI